MLHLLQYSTPRNKCRNRKTTQQPFIKLTSQRFGCIGGGSFHSCSFGRFVLNLGVTVVVVVVEIKTFVHWFCQLSMYWFFEINFSPFLWNLKKINIIFFILLICFVYKKTQRYFATVPNAHTQKQFILSSVGVGEQIRKNDVYLAEARPNSCGCCWCCCCLGGCCCCCWVAQTT